MTAVMGVDPGVSGGLAVLRGDGTLIYMRGFSGAMLHGELIDVMKCAIGLLKAQDSRECFMEKVGFIRGDGGKGAFTFGTINGLLRGCSLALNVTVHDVYPALWQSRLECLTGGNKNVSKRRALELFPGERITHAVADALLIAEYGRRTLARP